MKLQLSPHVKEACNRAILITGGARNGTTIIGKLIHSFENVEYVFEPPTLHALLPLIDSLETAAWNYLYESYLYEDFFMNSIAGRNINCNRADDSSVYKAKSEDEIEFRLSKSFRKNDLEKVAASYRPAYKLPNMVPWVLKILRRYPGTQVVLMLRDPVGAIHSLLGKECLSDESLHSQNISWPCKMNNGVKVPFWVRDEDMQRWAGLDELNRAAYYCVRMQAPQELRDASICLSYEALVQDPHLVSRELLERLNLAPGAKTDAVLNSISRRSAEHSDAIFAHIDQDFRERLLEDCPEHP